MSTKLEMQNLQAAQRSLLAPLTPPRPDPERLFTLKPEGPQIPQTPAEEFANYTKAVSAMDTAATPLPTGGSSQQHGISLLPTPSKNDLASISALLNKPSVNSVVSAPAAIGASLVKPKLGESLPFRGGLPATGRPAVQPGAEIAAEFLAGFPKMSPAERAIWKAANSAWLSNKWEGLYGLFVLTKLEPWWSGNQRIQILSNIQKYAKLDGAQKFSLTLEINKTKIDMWHHGQY